MGILLAISDPNGISTTEHCVERGERFDETGTMMFSAMSGGAHLL